MVRQLAGYCYRLKDLKKHPCNSVILQMYSLRPREVQRLVQGHPARSIAKSKLQPVGPASQHSLPPLLQYPQEERQPTEISMLSFASESVMCSAPTADQPVRAVTGKCS